MINLFHLLTYTIIIVNTMIGFLVYFADRKAINNISFAILILFINLWAVSNFVADTSSDYASALLWTKLIFVSAAIFAWFLLRFFIIFPLKSKQISLLNDVILFLPCILICFLITTNAIISSIDIRPWGVNVIFGEAISVYALYYFVYLCAAFYVLFQNIRKENGKIRLQMQYMLVGLGLTVGLASITNFIIPLIYGFFYLSKFGHMFIIIFLIITTFAIIRHHLLDINIVIRKGFVYSSLVIILAALYLILSKYSNLFIVEGQVQPALKAFYLLAALLALLLHLALAVIVFFNAPKKRINRLFALLSLFIFVWVVGCFIQTYTNNFLLAIATENIASKFYVFIPALFIDTYYEAMKLRKRITIKLAYLFSLSLFILSFSGLFIGGVAYNYGARYLTAPGPLYILFPLYIAVIAYLSMNRLINERSNALGYERVKLDYLLLGGSMIILGVLFSFLMIYKIIFTPFDEMLNIAYGMIIGYAILKHRLMDINIVIRKGLIYSLLLGFLTGLYILGLYLISNLFGAVGTGKVTAFSIFSIFLFAFLFQPLRDKVQDLIDNFFYRGKYDYQKTLKELSLIERSVAGLDEMIDKIMHTIVDVIGLTNASLYVIEKISGQFVLKKAINIEPRRAIEANDPIIANIFAKKEALIIEGIAGPSKEVQDLASITKAAIIFPVIFKEELVGILTLGAKLSDEIYSDDDINLLSTLCNQMGVSIENSMLYEDAMESQKQLFQADKLSTVGALAAGLAHEIKNPIAAIKGFSQVIDDAIKEKDQDVINEFKNVVPRQLDRINELVEKLLMLSKPPKMIKEKVSVNILLEEIAKLLDKQAMKQNVEIVKDFQPVPDIIADPDQLTQAFLNLTLNAMQSIVGKGTINIRTFVGGTSKIVVEVKDSGVGISKEIIAGIFDPFYTTKESGSGLGLAVTKRIIADHHGKIEVESEVGKGTTFRVILPV